MVRPVQARGGAGQDGLAAFAACGNKLFLCRPAIHTAYLAHETCLLTQADEAEYLAKSQDQDQANRHLPSVPSL